MHLDEPLSDKEFNELDKFLMSDSVGDDGMTMDALQWLSNSHRARSQK